ncbi:MAG: hypothetical protein HQ581_14010 [Planctomycetes bacterium]|nr:hypothetical protein [Planctomycetota bacterium]
MSRSEDKAGGFSCRHCSRWIEADALQSGRRRQCPGCQAPVLVPPFDKDGCAIDRFADAPSYDFHQNSASGEPSYLSATCPVCFTRVSAPADQLGRKVPCPDCDTPVLISAADDPANSARPGRRKPAALDFGPQDGYDLYEGPGQPPASDQTVYQTYIPVICPVCQTRMHATEDQIGREMTCPDCHVPVVVRRPKEDRRRVVRPGENTEGYGVHKGVDQPPADSPSARGQYIPAVCPLCSTRLYAAPDQVGTYLTCPDCNEPFLVPLPPKKIRPKLPSAGDPGYEVGEGVDQPSADSQTAHAEYFTIFCPVCNTRMLATEAQVGQEMDCPDCRKAFPVRRPPMPPPPRPKFRPKKPTLLEKVGAAHLAIEPENSEPSRAEKPPPRTNVRGEPIDEEDEPRFDLLADLLTTHRRRSARDLVEMPVRPFVSGVFSFPFYPDVWTRWLTLSITGALVLAMAAVTSGLLASYEGGLLGALGSNLMGLAAFSFTGLIALAWVVVASVWCLTITGDTAFGSDAIHNWPDAVWIDWMFDAFYVVNSVGLSVAAGMGVAWALSPLGDVRWLSVPMAMVVCFPVLVLSMIDSNSALKPWSRSVWRSLRDARGTWAVFYAESAMLLVPVGVLAPLAVEMALFGDPPAWARAAAMVGVPVLVVATLMIYFRLLGRMAWYRKEHRISERRIPKGGEEKVKGQDLSSTSGS